MWLLDNSTPFAAERTWVRDEKGAEIWLVVVKGSFCIDENGRQILDETQTEVSHVPQFRGDPTTSSLLYEADLLHKKLRTDVILHASAFAPGGKPCPTVDARLKVANIDKSLRVHGDRVIGRAAFGIALSRPVPFTEMPITYERAFGGTDLKDDNSNFHRWEPRNPVGVGFATQKNHVFGTQAPNIEDIKHPYQDWGRGEPVGFGPIARHWQPRARFAGTYDSRWETTRKPLLPSDFDEHFYQSAPEDQQVDGFLRGGEVVELFNLTIDGYLRFRVPRVTLGLTTHFYDGTVALHHAVVHTLTVQPDRRRFELVWHSHLPCHHKVYKLETTNITLKRRMRVPSDELESGMWCGD